MGKVCICIHLKLGECTASEESWKETCVIEPLIEGLIESGSIRRGLSFLAGTTWSPCPHFAPMIDQFWLFLLSANCLGLWWYWQTWQSSIVSTRYLSVNELSTPPVQIMLFLAERKVPSYTTIGGKKIVLDMQILACWYQNPRACLLSLRLFWLILARERCVDKALVPTATRFRSFGKYVGHFHSWSGRIFISRSEVWSERFVSQTLGLSILQHKVWICSRSKDKSLIVWHNKRCWWGLKGPHLSHS